eukprot:1131986-Prymnesium_polylepis.1
MVDPSDDAGEGGPTTTKERQGARSRLVRARVSCYSYSILRRLRALWVVCLFVCLFLGHVSSTARAERRPRRCLAGGGGGGTKPPTTERQA